MSIKKLFSAADKTTTYSDFKTEKQTYDPVESSRNAEQLSLKQEIPVPDVDYTEPKNFAFYGSAYYYYKGALDRISDFYPYDGSLYEQNEFYNNLLPIEKHIFDKEYPRTTGYAILSADGWGSSTLTDGYGLPSTLEYITFKGGPNTGSTGASLVDQMPNEHSSKLDRSNIYDEDIYETMGLPSDYDKGTRVSNLNADFENGVSVEFWMKTGSIDTSLTEKQVIFDWWNQEAASSSKYGRILVELTSSQDAAGNANRPFMVTVMSGATTSRNFVSIGSSLHTGLSDWKHYAISMANTGSGFDTRLYVNGRLDERVLRNYDLNNTLRSVNSSLVSREYTSQKNLQGWWRLNTDPLLGVSGKECPDSSGHGRDGTSAQLPVFNASRTPNKYIAEASNNFSNVSTNERVNIGTAGTWNAIIGAGASSSKKMTFSAWVRKVLDGGGSKGRVIDFGNGQIALYTFTSEEVRFLASWDGSQVVWTTAASAISKSTWTHLAVTYDAGDSSNDPIIYVNGVAQSVSVSTGTKTGTFDGITDAGGFIGNRSDTNRVWKGQLADVAVWNSILTADEIKSIYSAVVMPDKVGADVAALNTKSAMGRIGALQTAPVGTSAAAGAGKLSGSIDEFRYWKVERDASEIAENYFDRIGGGTNSDISNTTLGVYFKFNEGIVGESSIDSIVADFSGRLSNGVWTGYGSNSRNTGSAMVSSSVVAREYRDPIVRTQNPLYTQLSSSLMSKGRFHDSSNNSAFVNYAPSWVLDQHENTENENLSIISHIVGSYFDKIYLLTKELPSLRHATHASASATPYPFSNHLPQSLGLYVPEIFTDATIREQLANRSDSELYEQKLHETKNLIYQNLYNNLAHIFKSKGTEKALRNVLRCFNIDDDLIKLKLYSDNNTYEITNNLRQIVSSNKSANFNKAAHLGSVIYQRVESGNPQSRGYISGTVEAGKKNEQYYGFTAEADIIFPRFFSSVASNMQRNFKQVSLFGVVSPKVDAGGAKEADYLSGVDTTTSNLETADFQVYAVREEDNSKNVYFKLESSGSRNPFPTLTSSVFNNVYDESRWNLSVRLKPKNMGVSGFVTGSSAIPYDLIFRGINSTLGDITNSFEISSSISYATGSTFSAAHKRVYAGAHRHNLTGTLLYNSDVKVSNVKFWTKFHENSSLDLHLFDTENSGISGSNLNIASLDTTSNSTNLINQGTLALEWNFDSLTASNGTGNFTTQDFSSGSSIIRNNYGWLGRVVGYQHTGYGHNFSNSSTSVVVEDRINSFKFIDPEEVVSSDMIQILNDDDELYGVTDNIPSYTLSVEKSMYQAISQEMLIFFAGVLDFNNLIGEPVNRYRMRYKDIDKLRAAFFRRVTAIKDVEKFVNYYKWFDEAISEIFSQLIPASAEFIEGTSNTIESHVLERNKYRTPFPTLEAKQPDPEAVIFGCADKLYPYSTGFSTLPSSPRKTDKHVDYWKRRAERTAIEITSGDEKVDTARESLREIINSKPTLSSSNQNVVFSTVDGTKYTPDKYRRKNFGQIIILNVVEPNTDTYKVGTNFDADKNLEFARAALYPAGPINRDDGVYVPQNILLSFIKDFTEIVDFKDPSKTPSKKVKRNVSVDYGRLHDQGAGYYRVKSSRAFPFNIISSSLNSGYQKYIQDKLGLNLEITNIHNDVYGPDAERPLQSPFTDAVVGGLQSRHQPVNFAATDTENTRAEAWKIQIGTCLDTLSGAIGMTGPDYPPPYAPASSNTYPYEHFPKAVLYRDMVAKRPINIKNIRISGSTTLGNYTETNEIVSSVGAFENPRHFVEEQPIIPTNVFHNNMTSSTSAKTFLDIKPNRNSTANAEHFTFVDDYSVGYLTGTINKSIIKARSSGPGGIEVMTPAFTDFRSDEYSVYNALPFKNLTVLRPYQGPSGTLAKADGASNSAVGIRVNDIHNEDYGLRSHLARHTARFGRDSLHVRTDPGATYDELPGLHKIHRNNIERCEPTYGWATSYLNNQLTNTKHLLITGERDNSDGTTILVDPSVSMQTKRRERIFDGNYAQNILPNSANGRVEFSISMWLRGFPNSQTDFMSLGWDGTFPIHRLQLQSNGQVKYMLRAFENSGETGTFTTTGQHLTGSDWINLTFTFSALNGNLSNNRPTASFYFNGVQYPGTWSGQFSQDFIRTGSTSLMNNFRNWENLDLDSPVQFFGKIDSNTSQWTGSIDEMAMWKTALTPADAAKYYNSGKPVNLTASSDSNVTKLISWWRMGDDPNDNTSITGSAPTQDISSNNKIVDVVSGANIQITARDPADDADSVVLAGTSSVGLLEGGATESGKDYVVNGYSCGQFYDNFYISHQIPRSTKQYSWITASLQETNGVVGFTPRDFKIIDSYGNPINAYNFVSASDVGSQVNSGDRRFGYVRSAGSQYLPQVATLNLNVIDAVTSSTNTLGFGNASLIKYINYPEGLIETAPASSRAANAFNNLMFKRGSQYGNTTWKRLRAPEDSPVLRYQRRNNQLSVFDGQKSQFNNYNVPPISLKDRLQVVSIRAIDGTNIKAIMTHEDRFFNQDDLDIHAGLDERIAKISPLTSVVAACYVSPSIQKINYVKYTENIFPSFRNEFMSHSVRRLGYANDYWDNSRLQRNIIDASASYTEAELKNYHGQWTNSYLRRTQFNRALVSGSCWVLDAPDNFTTREGPISEYKTPQAIAFKYGAFSEFFNPSWRFSGSAGTLQSELQSFFVDGGKYPASGTFGAGPGAYYFESYFSTDYFRANNAVVGPLYARKHMLGSPLSVAPPTSIFSSEAGRCNENSGAYDGSISPGGPKRMPWDAGYSVSSFSGEALWEAPENAGIAKSDSEGNFVWHAYPSVPGYDTYAEFRKNIKYQSRGQAIVPEYRISRNLEDYIYYGSAFVPGKTDYFDIPGTKLSSSQSGFYIDYSNSDFLRNFAQLSDFSGLVPSEIQLVCSASIKFHPYKGFFPAQRAVDLAAQFRRSYQGSFTSEIYSPINRKVEKFSGEKLESIVPGTLRPVLQPLFAPGILFNSIKAGIAVDYPIIFNKDKMTVGSHFNNYKYLDPSGSYQGSAVPDGNYVPEVDDYVIQPRSEMETLGLSDLAAYNDLLGAGGTTDGNPKPFWDLRIPFEAIVDPNLIANVTMADVEPHISASINCKTSFGESADELYTLMAQNFFGGVADFYLKDSDFTKLEANTVYKDDFQFKKDSVYMARVKLLRSVTGSRTYTFESGSFSDYAYVENGARALLPRLQTSTDLDTLAYSNTAWYQLPQDPKNAPGFYETFTMYSRPSAFGPAVGGVHGLYHYGLDQQAQGAPNYSGSGILPLCPYTASAHRSGKTYQVMDSITGYNWSFTPPYQNGEAWADLIFRPSASVSYDLERILAETKAYYWRVDAGPRVKKYGTQLGGYSSNTYGGSGSVGAVTDGGAYGYGVSGQAYSSLIHDPVAPSGQMGIEGNVIYGGRAVNCNAMQLSSSLDIFGVERVYKTTTNQLQVQDSGLVGNQQTNEVVGKRWVIKTKFETPMLNFNDQFGVRPVTASLSNKTIPESFGSGTVPNGMWHQFGTIPTDSKTGVFMEITDIPKNWLQGHYMVRLSGSIYNDNSPDHYGDLAKEGRVQSLRSLCGFTKDRSTRRIGELKESLTVKEAIVAVPYIITSTSESSKPIDISQLFINKSGKGLFRIPPSQIQAASKSTDGTPIGDSLATAGESIRKQLRVMEDYILPPQFDFLNYPEIPPIVMYFFEFDYTFDKNDLSYMWQNLMHRDYDRPMFKTAKTSHLLANNELFQKEDILNNQNLRWMVFKVKQKSQANYYDYKITEDKEFGVKNQGDNLQFNWPYDFFSIIETISMDASVLLKTNPEKPITQKFNGGLSSDNNTIPPNSTYETIELNQIATPFKNSDLQQQLMSTQMTQTPTVTVNNNVANNARPNTGQLSRNTNTRTNMTQNMSTNRVGNTGGGTGGGGTGGGAGGGGGGGY